jgi:hypothetical protein
MIYNVANEFLLVVTESSSGSDDFIDMVSVILNLFCDDRKLFSLISQNLILFKFKVTDGTQRRSNIPCAYLPGVSGFNF